MSYIKSQFFDEQGNPYSEIIMNNDPGYQEWLDDRQADRREAEVNTEELYNEQHENEV